MYNNKNIKLLRKNLINTSLKTGQTTRKFKIYDLILKIAILDFKNYYLLIAFSDFYLIVKTIEKLFLIY